MHMYTVHVHVYMYIHVHVISWIHTGRKTWDIPCKQFIYTCTSIVVSNSINRNWVQIKNTKVQTLGAVQLSHRYSIHVYQQRALEPLEQCVFKLPHTHTQIAHKKRMRERQSLELPIFSPLAGPLPLQLTSETTLDSPVDLQVVPMLQKCTKMACGKLKLIA